MAPFRFRLATVMEWYRKRCESEENRLRLFVESAAQIRTEIERLKDEALRKTELIRSPDIQAFELAALAAFCLHARQVERQLLQKHVKAEQAITRQREVAQAARQRLRLVEKLRERRFEEHRLEVERELEELASETHLAGIARALDR